MEKYIVDFERNYIFSLISHKIGGQLHSKYFVDNLNKVTYEAINTLINTNKPITFSTLFKTISSNSVVNFDMYQNIYKSYDPIPIEDLRKAEKEVKENYYKVSIHEFFDNNRINAFKPEVSVMKIIEDNEDFITSVLKDIDQENASMDSVVNQALNRIIKINKGEQLSYFKTSIPELDRHFAITSRDITLLGGAAKQGKTKFLIWYISLLLKNNEDIAVKWYNMEDENDKMVRAFIAQETHIKDGILEGKERALTKEELVRVKEASKNIKKWNIDFNDRPKYIEEIKKEFMVFHRKNKGSNNFLIIDNAMYIKNKEHDRDDIIMNTLNEVKQITNASIIIIHHFNDEHMHEDRLKYAFRPLVKHLKGRESYRRTPKKIALFNYPGKYPQLLDEYKGYEDILQHLFILEIAVNRDDNNNETKDTRFVYFYADLDHNIFVPINKLLK